MRSTRAMLTETAPVLPSPAPSSPGFLLETARAAAAITLIGGWCGYFLFTGMPQLSLHVFPRTLVLHVMFGALAALYIALLALKRRLPGGSPLDLPVLAFVGAYALATATSISWRVSLEPTLYLGAAAILFYALSDAPFISSRELRLALVFSGIALALYAVWIVGDDYADYLRLVRRVEGLSASNIFPPTVPRVHDVSDHPNVLAMVLTLVIPFAGLGSLRGSRWQRLAWAGGLLLCGMAMFLTLSRGGWLGAAVGLAFTVFGAWLTLQAHGREQQGFAPSWENAVPRDISPTAIAALGGAILLIGGGTLAFLSSASTRPGWLFRGSLSPREDAWDVALDIFADHPLTGAGPHTFGLLYPGESGEFLVHTQHAHNGFLQVADDAGLLGLGALLLIAMTVAFMLLKTWREGDLTQRLVAVACGGALLGFSAHNLVDAGNIWKAPPIALALVGAIVVRTYRERADPRPLSLPRFLARIPPRPRSGVAVAFRAAILLLLVVPFFAWWRIDRAHYDYYLGADAYNEGDGTAIERLQRAVDRDSSVMVYRLLLGQAQAQRFVDTGKADTSLIRAAIVNLEQARRLDPRSDLARANLARAYELAGRDEDAAAQAQITRLATRHVPPVLAVAEVYEDLGRDTDAVSAYAQVLSMDASLADSAFWELTEWRRQHFDEILESSVIALNPCTEGAYLAEVVRRDNAGDDGARRADLERTAEGCKLLLFSLPNDLTLRVALAKIQSALGERDDAFGHLRYAIDRQPDFGPARTELGRWYAVDGDLESARHEWVVGEQLDEPESVMLLGNSYRPQDRPSYLTGRLRDLLGGFGSSVQNDVVSVLYYRLRYGRLSPVTAIIPATWQTAVPRLYGEMQGTLARWESEAGE
jgi:O-antigen ligase/Flp pilus assembly protein TadD